MTHVTLVCHNKVPSIFHLIQLVIGGHNYRFRVQRRYLVPLPYTHLGMAHVLNQKQSSMVLVGAKSCTHDIGFLLPK